MSCCNCYDIDCVGGCVFMEYDSMDPTEEFLYQATRRSNERRGWFRVNREPGDILDFVIAMGMYQDSEANRSISNPKTRPHWPPKWF